MASRRLFISWTLTFVGVNAAEDSLSDFSNDLATDLGTLLALFGEPMTKQYLSESTTYLDYFIFAMGPIGILTAIVSAIRVCGHSSLRAFVGRSREGNGVVEAELCTSTSRDVCELFNRGGITRVLGRPKILEFVYLPPSENQIDSTIGNSRIYLFRDYLNQFRYPKIDWTKANGPGWKRLGPSALNPPNLSLNVGIVRQGGWKYVSVALLGFLLQAGVLFLAGIGVWVLDWNLSERDDSASRNYAPTMFIVGTTVMCSGLWACAALIGQTTEETQYKRYKRKTGGHRRTSQLIWLQPNQVMGGDQSFDPFAFFEKADEPLQTWTSSKRNMDEKFELYTFLAVPAVLIGYIMHFIGLRGMKAWVSLAQLGTTVVMSLLRGLLRMKRLRKNDNKLADKPEMVLGFELDWLAFELPKTTSTSTAKKKDHNQRLQPGDYQQLLYLRRRLAHLTGHVSKFDAMIDVDYQRWADSYVVVRHRAKSVAAALCAAAEILIHKDQPRNDIFFSIPAFSVPNPPSRGSDIKIALKAQDTSSAGGWTVDSPQIEAILGLAMWSLMSDARVVSEPDSNFKMSVAKDIRTWRIIFAKPQQRIERGMQDELSLWFGPNATQFTQSTLRVDRNGSYSLYDLWTASSGGTGSWDPVASGAQIGARASYILHRSCGWIPVMATLRALREKASMDCSEPEIHARETTVEISAQIVKSDDSLLDVCAQELFTALVVGLKDGLHETGLRSDFEDKLSVTADDNHVRLQIPVISTLAKTFEDAGLGTHSTSFLCIIPALKSPFGLGDPKAMFPALIKRATEYRQASDWPKAELLLNYLLSYIVASCRECVSISDTKVVGYLLVRTFRAMGELYRWSLAQSSDNTRVAFGKRGLNQMHEMRRRFRQETQQILKIMTTYRGVADDLDGLAERNEREPFSNITGWGSGKHPLVQAIMVRDRRKALFQLCFLKLGDFSPAGVTWVKSDPLADALPLAARNDWEEVVSALLEMGADPNGRDGEGRSAVSYCRELGNELCLEILMANGASDEDST
ncbi:hypothetical protein CPLU01_03465 [Colletotrichum plurivorum]|uniref:Ankyrin repeat protein n=1 Tax=Colletotrichum plurivorum TaxID=2175906 RepID=A0A8H6NLC0_9PEZI|nr:hypothetical protein CPLU01_03465 [Colletotrichum plurivorum]